MPNSYVLSGDLLEQWKKHSSLIEMLAENSNSQEDLEISKELLHLDTTKWNMLVDLFEGNQVFVFGRNGKISLNERKGYTKEEITNLFDYLMVDKPSTMYNYMRNMARGQLNAPRNTEARGQGVRKAPTYRTANRNNNRPYENNNNNFQNNNEGNNEQLNFVNNEEEEMYSKLSGKNFGKYAPKTHKGGRRSRRATRKSRR